VLSRLAGGTANTGGATRPGRHSMSAWSLDAPWPASRVVVRFAELGWGCGDGVAAVLALGEALPEVEWLLLGGARSRPLFEGLDEPFRLPPAIAGAGHAAHSFLQAIAMLRREQASTRSCCLRRFLPR